jgi:cytochrome c biogenesis protein
MICSRARVGAHSIVIKDKRNSRVNTEKKKKTKDRGGILSSLKLTIPLLIVLAALSVIGTLIPQNAPQQEYIRRYGTQTFYMFKGLGLLDMYHSWWFIGVLILLAANLIACSMKRLPGVWQQVRKTKSGYARLGTYLTHFSVLLILVGGLIGALWGFKGYMEITEGETVERMVLNNPQHRTRSLGFQIRCESFRVAFYPDGAPREYVSTLTLLDGGEVVRDHVPLRVNHPISYRGLTLYQASYGHVVRATLGVSQKGGTVAPHTVQLTLGEVKPIPGTQVQIGMMQYEEKVHDLGEGILLVLFTPGSQPEGFWLFKRRTATEGLRVRDFTFIFKDLEKRYYTGIQVNHDPGVPIVWVGCSLLVIGMVGRFTLRRPEQSKTSRGR